MILEIALLTVGVLYFIIGYIVSYSANEMYSRDFSYAKIFKLLFIFVFWPIVIVAALVELILA